MSKAKAPAAPAGLGAAGSRLWRRVAGEFALDGDEVGLLEQAARQADVVAALEAVVAEQGPMSLGSAGQPVVHPAVVEGRLARLAVGSLLARLRVPVAADGTRVKSPRHKAAADARWARERALRAVD